MDVLCKANLKLEYFIKNNLASCHKLTNYYWDIDNRSNISQISNYVSHRKPWEYEIIKELELIYKEKKFTDEVLWKIYWTGFLENHKSRSVEYKNRKIYYMIQRI